jgi:hypothetical protein
VTTTPVDELAVPWAVSSPLWTVAADACADALGRGELGMLIRSAAGEPADPAPSAERRFAPPLDLGGADELRLWLRSTRAADGSPTRPFYLAIEATTDPPEGGMSWVRFLPIPRPDVFALHRLWLADMPAPLHRAIGYLRLRSLDPTTAFEAAIDDIVAVRPEPVGDVEAALVARLEGLGGLPTVLVDVPENPGTQTPPFVLVTPWSLAPLDRVAAADEIVDNYTETGAFVRPATASLQLEYRIDVFADDRASKAQFLDAIVASILSDARLVVANVPLSLVPFVPPSEVAATIEPGRTPLFVRVTTQVETGPRNRRDFAVPFVVAGPADGRETAEAAAA